MRDEQIYTKSERTVQKDMRWLVSANASRLRGFTNTAPTTCTTRA